MGDAISPPLFFSADYDVSWLALDETVVTLRRPDLPAQSSTQRCFLRMSPSGKNTPQCHASTRGPLASQVAEDLSPMLAQTRDPTLCARGKAGVLFMLGPQFYRAHVSRCTKAKRQSGVCKTT
ncbi:unnamed protein product [Effrenium voratum]|uniref:Uncharacterized protein n=1 Tax=Effrenium voratum TaxID=2562239 RepID=A0AA36MP04_9DINO|nr:unnamed protein product [Effrenium voratum]